MTRTVIKIFAFVGCLLLLLGFYLSSSNYRLRSQGVYATGRVIENVEVESTYTDDGSTYTRNYFYPKISFENRSKETVTFQSGTGSDPPSYELGDTVEIVYLEGESSEAQVAGSLWFGPILCFVLAFALILFSLLLSRIKPDE